MATAKIETVNGLRMKIFARSLQKNTTCSFPVWVVGMDVERRLCSAGKCVML